MDIKSLIAQKQSKKNNKHLTVQDINHDLIVSLLAVSVYGKPARDEDILKIIINGPAKTTKFDLVLDEMRDSYQARVKEAGTKLTRKKDGTIRDENGFILLQPK